MSTCPRQPSRLWSAAATNGFSWACGAVCLRTGRFGGAVFVVGRQSLRVGVAMWCWATGVHSIGCALFLVCFSTRVFMPLWTILFALPDGLPPQKQCLVVSINIPWSWICSPCHRAHLPRAMLNTAPSSSDVEHWRDVRFSAFHRHRGGWSWLDMSATTPQSGTKSHPRRKLRKVFYCWRWRSIHLDLLDPNPGSDTLTHKEQLY